MVKVMVGEEERVNTMGISSLKLFFYFRTNIQNNSGAFGFK